MHAYGTQPSLVKRLCDIYMMVWPGWGATNTSGRESTWGLYALKQKYHLGEGKIGLRVGGSWEPPEGGGGGVWQWGSCDRTLGKVPITSKRGC